MSINDGNNGDDEDNWLWQEMTKDAKPIAKQKPLKEPEKIQQQDTKPKAADPVPKTRAVMPPKQSPAQSSEPKNQGIDKRNDERLRRGQMPIDGRLDLHGHRLHEAHEALLRMVQSAHTQGKRCLLIITGKGTPRGNQAQDWMDQKPGVIKENFQKWLSEPPLRDIVLKHYPAQPKDGGGGAFYVLLRRKR